MVSLSRPDDDLAATLGPDGAWRFTRNGRHAVLIRSAPTRANANTGRQRLVPSAAIHAI